GAPAILGDAALKDRGPEGAGDVLAAGDEGEGSAAVLVEPTADIDVAGGVDAADAEHADEHAVTEPEQPGAGGGRGDGEADTDHEGAESHGPTGADAFGDSAHQEAADRGAEPGERVTECGDGAGAAQFGRDRLEGDDGDEGCTERKGHHSEHGEGDGPGGAG